MKWRIDALAHARAEAPREACGLVVVVRGRERYVPCANLASSDEQFMLSPEDYAAADRLGEIVAVVHSHPSGRLEPSQADRVACEASGLPWMIVSPIDGLWVVIAPTGYSAPLVGREWAYGVLDCYSVLRDWFATERGVHLDDYPRPQAFGPAGDNPFLDHFAAQGFAPVPADALAAGDALLMRVAGENPNHVALYLGDGQILHHLRGRLSSRDLYSGYWQSCTTHTLRLS